MRLSYGLEGPACPWEPHLSVRGPLCQRPVQTAVVLKLDDASIDVENALLPEV